MPTSRQHNWFDLVLSLGSKPAACLLLLFAIQWGGLQLHIFTHSTGTHRGYSVEFCSVSEFSSRASASSHKPCETLVPQASSDSWLTAPESDQPAPSLTSQCPLCILALELHNLSPPDTCTLCLEILADVQHRLVALSVYSHLLASLQSSRAPPTFTVG